MRWRLEFYSERRALVAGCEVEAPTPEAAVRVGRQAVLAEHPPVPGRRRLGLFARAQRVGGQDASGWVLHRILKT